MKILKLQLSHATKTFANLFTLDRCSWRVPPMVDFHSLLPPCKARLPVCPGVPVQGAHLDGLVNRRVGLSNELLDRENLLRLCFSLLPEHIQLLKHLVYQNNANEKLCRYIIYLVIYRFPSNIDVIVNIHVKWTFTPVQLLRTVQENSHCEEFKIVTMRFVL